MRSLCTCLAGVILSGPLVFLASGCGGASELEKPPEIKKDLTIDDMPGYNGKRDMTPKKK